MVLVRVKRQVRGAKSACGRWPLSVRASSSVLAVSQDTGSHTVCAVMTAEFLAFSKYLGNDLSTPRPEFGFAGLKTGDRWCLCAGRFLQAHQEGCAPQVQLESTHQKALDIVPIEILQLYAAPK